MRGKTVLVVSKEAASRRRVDAPLASAGNRVVRAPSAEDALECIEAGDVDLALVDHDTIREIPAILEVTKPRIPLVALASRSQAEGILELVCDHGVQNLLARKSGEGERTTFDPGEVLVTVEKIFRHDVFGIEKYLPGFGIEIESRVLTRATDREPAIERVNEFMRHLGAGSQLSSTAGVVADELITNAIYNAPRDPHGAPIYASTSRREKITLLPHEFVTMAMGSNGEKFAISVTDQFGAFMGDHLRSGLRRCLSEDDPIQQKDGGAGIGLYMVLSSCSQLVINVAPGLCTEVIAIWDLEKRLRGVRMGGHSLHVFMADATDRRVELPSPRDAPAPRREERVAALARAVRDTIPVQTPAPDSFGEAAQEDTLPEVVRAAPSFDEAITAAGSIEVEAKPPAREERMARARTVPPTPYPLEELHEVLLLRPPGRPALREALAQIHHAETASDCLTAALVYICSRWPAAVLLRRNNRALEVWCAAGDVYDWNGLSAYSAPAQDLELLTNHSYTPVAKIAPSCGDVVERELASRLIGTDAAACLVLSVSLSSPGDLVIFAARQQVESWQSVIPYERVLRQIFVRLKALYDGQDRAAS
jgi:CheY-like chemotaxis protein